jgi:hypothetical protein
VPARVLRATAVLFAFGSVLTLVDAVLTMSLLRQPGMTEQWAPVRLLIDAFGIEVALAFSSMLAVGALAAVSWGVVRARPPIASAAFVVLCVAIGARVCGCVNNVGVMLS